MYTWPSLESPALKGSYDPMLTALKEFAPFFTWVRLSNHQFQGTGTLGMHVYLTCKNCSWEAKSHIRSHFGRNPEEVLLAYFSHLQQVMTTLSEAIAPKLIEQEKKVALGKLTDREKELLGLQKEVIHWEFQGKINCGAKGPSTRMAGKANCSDCLGHK